MFDTFVLGLCLIGSVVSVTTKGNVLLPCKFGAYDMNSDGVIKREEFLERTEGFPKMPPQQIFNRLDTNGDGNIIFAEFRRMAPGLQKNKIFAHCDVGGWLVFALGNKKLKRDW
ncbi:neuron-specific calcium-binding protein hippocalcin-like [Ostrea edulis]|uniref:neuron-specific calcium-binding protein hippocalcin-like n=1 Tax=Ostrea edulis TaxID=37623 RepID=UPI0020963E3E|nr:neuron-specific calcium-binding protein hippocalcin-like [Ostrea edulis]